MLEKDIERKLVREVKAYGGKAYKFVSPGNVGVPDRIVIWPDGEVHFIELKTQKGNVTKLQNLQIRELMRLKQKVFILWGLEGVLDYVMEYGAIHGECKV